MGDMRWIVKGSLTEYKSSEHVVRSFCSVCGSNVCLKYLFQSDTVWITPSLIDDDGLCGDWWQNARVLHIFCASKSGWSQIAKDGHPRLNDEGDIAKCEVD